MKLPRLDQNHGLKFVGLMARFALTACFSLGATALSAGEQEISCEKAPAEVLTAFKKAYPNATIKECAKEVENGKTTYEVMSSEGKMGRDVLFGADGKIIVVEETVDPADLPEPVKQAMARRFPGDPIELAEKLTRDTSVSYEMQVRQKGERVEVVFDADGNEVKP